MKAQNKFPLSLTLNLMDRHTVMKREMGKIFLMESLIGEEMTSSQSLELSIIMNNDSKWKDGKNQMDANIKIEIQ